LHEGQQVDVQPRVNIPDAHRVHVEPVSPDDWEILELNQHFIEEQFINQVNVLFERETIPLWIHQTIVINLRIVKIEPPLTTGSVSHHKKSFLLRSRRMKD
jgi:peroxin-1